MIKIISISLFLLLVSFGIGVSFYIRKVLHNQSMLNSKKEKLLKSDIKMMSDIIKNIPDYLLPSSFRLAIGKVWQDRIFKLQDIIGEQNTGVKKYTKQSSEYIKKALAQDRGAIIDIKTQEEADTIITKLKSLYSIVSRLERRNRISKDIADKFNSAIHQAATRVTVELLQNNTTSAIEQNRPEEAIANLNQVVKELKKYRGMPNHPYRQVLKDSVNSINRLKQEIKLQNMMENKQISSFENTQDGQLPPNFSDKQISSIAKEFLKQASLENPDPDSNVFKANSIEKKLKW